MHDEHDRDLTSERIAELPDLYKPSPYVEPDKGGADLATLAEQINAEHEACGAAMTAGLVHAIRAGEMLMEAKRGVGHGGWTGWLKANVTFSVRTAQGYMRVARNQGRFIATPINPETGKTQPVALLGLRDTLQALAEPTKQERRALDAAPEAPERRTEAATLRAERRAATEAVAGANDVTPEAARRDLRTEVDEVRNAVEHESERREERGEDFPAEEREDYARRLAEGKKRIRDVQARHREQQSKNRGQMFMEMDANLSKARRAVREALDVATRGGFEGEELELLERRHDALRGLLNLVGAALAGDSGTDWDAELAKLGE